MAPVLSSLPILDFDFEESDATKSASNCKYGKVSTKAASIFDPFSNSGPRFPYLDYDLQLSEESDEDTASSVPVKTSENGQLQQMESRKFANVDTQLKNMPSLPVLYEPSKFTPGSNTSAGTQSIQLLESDLHLSDDDSDDDSHQRLTGTLDLDDHSPKEVTELNSLPVDDDRQNTSLDQSSSATFQASKSTRSVDVTSSKSSLPINRAGMIRAKIEIVKRKPNTAMKDQMGQTDRNCGTAIEVATPNTAKYSKYSDTRNAASTHSDRQMHTPLMSLPTLDDDAVFNLNSGPLSLSTSVDAKNHSSKANSSAQSTQHPGIDSISKFTPLNNRGGLFKARIEIVKRKPNNTISKVQKEQIDGTGCTRILTKPNKVATSNSAKESMRCIPSPNISNSEKVNPIAQLYHKNPTPLMSLPTLDNDVYLSEKKTFNSHPFPHPNTSISDFKSRPINPDPEIPGIISSALEGPSTNSSRGMFRARIEVVKRKSNSTVPEDNNRRRERGASTDGKRILLNPKSSNEARLSRPATPAPLLTNSTVSHKFRRSPDRKKHSPMKSLPILSDDGMTDGCHSTLLSLPDLRNPANQLLISDSTVPQLITDLYLSDDSDDNDDSGEIAANLLEIKNSGNAHSLPVLVDEPTAISLKPPIIFQSNPSELNLSEESDVEDDSADERNDFKLATTITMPKNEKLVYGRDEFNPNKAMASRRDTPAPVPDNSKFHQIIRKSPETHSDRNQPGRVQNNKRKSADAFFEGRHLSNTAYAFQRDSSQSQPLTEIDDRCDQTPDNVQFSKKRHHSGKENMSRTYNSESGSYKKRLSLPNNPTADSPNFPRTGYAPRYNWSPNRPGRQTGYSNPPKRAYSKSSHNFSPENKQPVYSPASHSQAYSRAEPKSSHYVKFSSHYDVCASYQIICDKVKEYRKEMLKHEAMVDRRRKAGVDLESISRLEREIFKFRGWLLDEEYLKQYLETYSMEVRIMLKKNGLK